MREIRALLRRRLYVWLGLLALLGTVLAFVPLFDVLGFELAFAVALVASFGAADLAADLVRRSLPMVPHVDVAKLVRQAAVQAWLLLVPPLVIVSLNALRVRNCDPATGLLFYLALPGLSTLLAAATGVVWGLVLRGRRRLVVAAAWLWIVASLLVALLRFYTGPAIFAYDPYAGYFPGTLYDEHITLAPPFWWSRLYQLALAGLALFGVAAWLRPRRRAFAGAAACGALAAFLFAKAGALGFVASADDIARALEGRHETEHFIIVYPAGASFAHEIPDIAREHELRYAQLQQRLGVAPRGKITSFYFASADEKKRWMGASRTFIAKPWRNEIYLQHAPFPHPVLRHELAHVFAGAVGDPVFGVSVKWLGWPPVRFNVGLIEGIAVAADWPGHRGGMTPHEACRALLDKEQLPPIRSLLAPGFLTFNPAKSYTVAGSFVYYLLEAYGPERLRRLYRSGGAPGDFASIYGVSLEELEAGWHAELRKTPVDEKKRAVAAERFRRKGIFERPCPHAVADRLATASDHLAKNRPDEAVRVLERVCRDDPGEPNHRASLAVALERAGREDEALAIHRELAQSDENPGPFRARAWLRVADVLGRRGDIEGGAAAVAQARALPVDEDLERLLSVYAHAFDAGEPGAKAIRDYLLLQGPGGRDADPLARLLKAVDIAAALPQSGLGHYLLGRLVSGRDAHADAARHLARARELGLPDRLLLQENDRLLMTEAFLAGDLATARRAAFRLSAPENDAETRLDALDWLERLRYAEATGWRPGTRSSP